MKKEKFSQNPPVRLMIDGHLVTVPKGTTVYQAAQTLNLDIPIFCYQDRMPPFGACRVCLVEVEKTQKLQTSCTLEAVEGMVVHTQSKAAAQGRKEILEFLLINHPLDCPICDRAGECPLQENTLKFGPGESRFFEEKKHFEKAKQMGPVLMLDKERCIVCARCTRFGQIIAGDHALTLIDRGAKTEVGTLSGSCVESKFIGNTIMICPVGALTSQVYRFQARPWDNKSTASTCPLCPVGCSLTLDSRDGQIVRTRSLENPSINDMWLCDKGWFGYEFIHHPERLTTPLIRKEGKLKEAGWKEALDLIVEKLKQGRETKKIAGFGGSPLTVEESYLFQKIIREGIKVNHLDYRIGEPLLSLEEEGLLSGMELSLAEIESLDFVYLLGLDLTEEFPVIWLRLKQAINQGTRVCFLGHYKPEISPYFEKTVLHAPGKELDILSEEKMSLNNLLKEGKKGAFFLGRQYLQAETRKEVLNELLEMKRSFPQLTLNLLEGQDNGRGARFAGLRPDLAPLEVPLESPGLNATQVLEEASLRGWDMLWVAGANPALKVSSLLWKKALQNLDFLVVQDLFLTETAKDADLVLPTLCFAEKEGSFITIDGQIQKFRTGKKIPKNQLSDQEIFLEVADRLGLDVSLEHPFYQALKQERLPLKIKEVGTTFLGGCSTKEKNSYSLAKEKEEALAVTFSSPLFNRGVRMKHNTHLIQLTKEPKFRIHPNEGVKRGVQQGQSIVLVSSSAKLKGRLVLDEGVSLGVIVLPLGFEELCLYDLCPSLRCGQKVWLQKETLSAC